MTKDDLQFEMLLLKVVNSFAKQYHTGVMIQCNKMSEKKYPWRLESKPIKRRRSVYLNIILPKPPGRRNPAMAELFQKYHIKSMEQWLSLSLISKTPRKLRWALTGFWIERSFRVQYSIKFCNETWHRPRGRPLLVRGFPSHTEGNVLDYDSKRHVGD
jgi:hypothetical protein